MKVIAAIPAFNEESSIGSVVLKAKQHADHVVVIDDGSLDRTSEIAELAGAEVIKHMKNSGYGAAIRTCFETARNSDADALVIIDGDGQHSPDNIPSLIEPIRSGNADIVIGSRFLETRSNIPKYRRAGMKILDAATNMGSEKVSDSQSGFRAYSKNFYSTINLTSKDMGVGSEILMRARENNFRIHEVPISVRYDVGKPSKNPLSHGITVLMTIIKLISQKRPLFFFGATGSILLLIGVASGWWVMDIFNTRGGLAVGTALITVILVITGIFTILTGIILYAVEDTIRRTIGERKH